MKKLGIMIFRNGENVERNCRWKKEPENIVQKKYCVTIKVPYREDNVPVERPVEVRAALLHHQVVQAVGHRVNRVNSNRNSQAQ